MSVGTLNLGPPPVRSTSRASPGANLGGFSPIRRAPRRHELRRPSGYLEVDASPEPHRLGVLCSSSQSSVSLDLPLLPFQPDEVFVPSECKTLHLYEARFLALLEESLNRREKHFVHFVLDPVHASVSSTGASFVAKYGCLVFIENTEPYLRGIVIPMQDKIHANGSDINSKVAALKESLCNLNSLEIKLKAYKDELLQTRIKNSLIWAEKETSMDCIEAFIPGAAERMSFAALQPVSGSTQLELLALRRRKLWAMTSRDTLERLRNGLELVEHNIALVAAKLAIQSVEM